MAQRSLYPFSILPGFYEKKLDEKYGISLKEIDEDTSFVPDSGLEHYLRVTNMPQSLYANIVDKIMDIHQHQPSTSSLSIKNRSELELHLSTIHELAYRNYATYKKQNDPKGFPSRFCRRASFDLYLNLFFNGYSNPLFIDPPLSGHAYLGLPFVFNNKTTGVIIVDPTSDQLSFNDSLFPRNNILLLSRGFFEYDANILSQNYDGITSLFPKSKQHGIHSFSYSNLNSIRTFGNAHRLFESLFIDLVLDEAFMHPINVEPKLTSTSLATSSS